ncbi:MAG: FMN-binding protein [Spirochaetales bacterium]|nr:FMN-binding protein [Spirochaetales bacterium]
MTDMLKIGGRLALICAVAALCLGAVNAVTEPKIDAARVEKLQNALAQVSPGGTIGEEVLVDDAVVESYYKLDDNGKTIGYILNLKGSGYGGDLIILAGFLSDGTLYNTVLMEDDETPGLGKEAEKASYMKKYLGFSGSNIPSAKSQLDQTEADAISGASITFTGIGKALEAGSVYVTEMEGK